ncbi:MAG: hypothetical protein AB1673_17425 [Actinomycetota bacterium]
MRARTIVAALAAAATLSAACGVPASGPGGSLAGGPGTGAARGDPPVPPGGLTVAAFRQGAAPPPGGAQASATPRSPVDAPGLPLPGCPPPPRPPSAGPVDPGPVYVPPVLVPEADLPAPVPPGQWTPQLGPLEGKGMWLWKYFQSEGGNADAIVERAAAAGLRQLWVRVGDSKDGFYARDVLDQLVPRAHRRGIAVIGWGFPFLFDPVDDARWSAEALSWRSPDGHVLDGFSPDIELQTEGVAISEARATVYTSLVRQAAGDRLVVATVYRPSDRLWPDRFPYAAIAPYVDAFAPMVYWYCLEPGTVTAQAIERLGTLRPVHPIGQAYDGTPDGGRGGPPTAHETNRFLDVAVRHGALGASFWVWHLAGEEQWSAVAAFDWPGPGGR